MTEMRDAPTPKPRRRSIVPVEVCGAAVAFLGGLAFVAPLLAPALAAVVFASVLLAAGAVGALALTSARQAEFTWRALWVAVATLAGLAVLYHHETGRLSLPWVVGIGSLALAAAAAAQVWLQGFHRRLSWGWLVVGVIFTLAEGLLLLRAGPHAGVMILALFVAANLIVFGLTLITTGLIDRASASLL